MINLIKKLIVIFALIAVRFADIDYFLTTNQE